MKLVPLLRTAETDFRSWDRHRERLLDESRRLVRQAGALIRDLHRGREEGGLWRAFDRSAASVLRRARKRPEFLHAGFVQQGLGEYAEAIILRASLRGRKTPPKQLRTLPGDAILLGAADAIGELRRAMLDRLNRDDLRGAQTAFAQMESLFGALQDAEAPEALVPLRAKRDQARGILERSRGDLVAAKKSKELERKIDDVASLLDEAEGRARKARKKPDPDELDLDSAWSKK